MAELAGNKRPCPSLGVGPSHASASTSSSMDISIPPPLLAFVHTSVKEFKSLRHEHEKTSKYLQKLRVQFEEGTIPNSLRMSPPKLQIGDPEAQSVLDASLAECTTAYRIKCFEALIKAQESRLASLTHKLEQSKPVFETRLSDLISPLRSLNLIGDKSKSSIESWHLHLSNLFVTHVDAFLIHKQLSDVSKAAAIAARNVAREGAMEEAETLPVEPSIATLVKREVVKEVLKEVKKVVNSIQVKPKAQKLGTKPASKPKANPGGKSGNGKQQKGIRVSTRSAASPTSFNKRSGPNRTTGSGTGGRKPSARVNGKPATTKGATTTTTKTKRPYVPPHRRGGARGVSSGTRS